MAIPGLNGSNSYRLYVLAFVIPEIKYRFTKLFPVRAVGAEAQYLELWDRNTPTLEVGSV